MILIKALEGYYHFVAVASYRLVRLTADETIVAYNE